MKTLDGNKNSAIPILDVLNTQSIKEYLSATGRKVITSQREHHIKSTNEYKIFRKICLKYTIMKVRAKLSFQSLLNRTPIQEMIFTTIYKSYRSMVSDGHIKAPTIKQEIHNDEIFNTICRGDISCLKNMIILNSENIESESLM